MRKPVFGFPTKLGSNKPRPQKKMIRGLKNLDLGSRVIALWRNDE